MRSPVNSVCRRSMWAWARKVSTAASRSGAPGRTPQAIGRSLVSENPTIKPGMYARASVTRLSSATVTSYSPADTRYRISSVSRSSGAGTSSMPGKESCSARMVRQKEEERRTTTVRPSRSDAFRSGPASALVTTCSRTMASGRLNGIRSQTLVGHRQVGGDQVTTALDQVVDEGATLFDDDPHRFQPQRTGQRVGKVSFQVEKVDAPGQAGDTADAGNQDAQRAVGPKRVEIAQLDGGSHVATCHHKEKKQAGEVRLERSDGPEEPSLGYRPVRAQESHAELSSRMGIESSGGRSTHS